MKHNSTSYPKYRPVLTASQIIYLLSRCKEPSELSKPDAISCIATLAPFLAKVQNNGIVAAYTTMPPKPSLLETLEGTQYTSNVRVPLNTDKLYQQWMDKNQSFDSFNLNEIRAIQEYRYLNDLMSPVEETEYESSQGLHIAPPSIQTDVEP